MREVLALAIDRATTAEVNRINKGVGKTMQALGYQWTPEETPYVSDSNYEHLLQEYVHLKLILHHTRRSMYYRDWYTEREDFNVTDIAKIHERSTELKRQIKAVRQTINYAAWGDLIPQPQPTPYDKPILHAMDEHTCSFTACFLQGRYWLHGKAYCRPHMRQAKTLANQERREKNSRKNSS